MPQSGRVAWMGGEDGAIFPLGFRLQTQAGIGLATLEFRGIVPVQDFQRLPVTPEQVVTAAEARARTGRRRIESKRGFEQPCRGSEIVAVDLQIRELDPQPGAARTVRDRLLQKRSGRGGRGQVRAVGGMPADRAASCVRKGFRRCRYPRRPLARRRWSPAGAPAAAPRSGAKPCLALRRGWCERRRVVQPYPISPDADSLTQVRRK